MATILLRMPVGAEPKVIHDALATSEGVNGWWSNRPTPPEPDFIDAVILVAV